MKTAINQATLMKTPMDKFLSGISKAGFDGVELRRDETFEYLKTHSVFEFAKKLKENNLKVVSWNAIELFSLCKQEEFQGMLDYSETLMKIGKKIGCDLIIAVPSFADQSVFPKEQTFEKTVERLQILRKLAKKYEFRMGFEPLGFPNCSVRKIDDALNILKESEKDGLPKSGLVIDTFHFFLGEHKPEELSKIDLERLWLVHFNDCVEKKLSELQDSDRVWPGEGFFDLTGFVSELKKMNYSGYVSMELFNPEYWTMNPELAAKQSIETLKKYL
jgi:2-keto-myo-inositol isomerase